MIILVSFAIPLVSIYTQEETKPSDEPLTDVFESIWLIDNQTVVVPRKGTFEFDIMHRFGTWDKGYDDFWGFFAPSNFRLGFNYVPINKLQLGFGFSKENLVWDFNAKYAILEQSRGGAKPLSITYLVNMAIDTRKLEKTIYNKSGDGYAYFHQLMLARKFSDKLSLQVASNLTHFNFVDAFLDANNNPVAKRENNHFSISMLGRLKIADAMAIIANVDIPVTDHNIDSPKTNISFGLEFATSGHAFQVFVGNYKSTIPQYNHFYNLNSFDDNKILIGFNMTRLWAF